MAWLDQALAAAQEPANRTLLVVIGSVVSLILSGFGVLLAMIGRLCVKIVESIRDDVKSLKESASSGADSLKAHQELDARQFHSLGDRLDTNAREVRHEVGRFTDNVTATMGNVQLDFATLRTEIRSRMPERREEQRTPTV